MNNYGQPSGPEIAMLDELHTLWGRVFRQRPAEAQPRPRRALPVLAIVSVAAVVLLRLLL